MRLEELVVAHRLVTDPAADPFCIERLADGGIADVAVGVWIDRDDEAIEGEARDAVEDLQRADALHLGELLLHVAAIRLALRTLCFETIHLRVQERCVELTESEVRAEGELLAGVILCASAVDQRVRASRQRCILRQQRAALTCGEDLGRLVAE